jgi:hypothetical protein
VILPVSIDLSVVRTVPGVLGLLVLVGGLIWEAT